MTTAKFRKQIDELKTIIVYTGATTADGDPSGNSIICSALVGSNDFISGKSVIILSGPNIYNDMLIDSFDASSGTIWLWNNFPSQIMSGTSFAILAIPSSTALQAYIWQVVIVLTNMQRAIFNSTSVIDYWSPTLAQVSLPGNVASNITLPNITIPPGSMTNGTTIVRAVIMFKFRIIENTSGSPNALSGAQSIFIDVNGNNGFTQDAMDFVDQLFTMPASVREGGDVIISSVDISSFMAGLDYIEHNTLNFQWTDSLASQSNLNFDDVEIGVRIFFNYS